LFFGTLRILPDALESSLYGTSEGRGSHSRREDRIAFEEFSFLPVFAQLMHVEKFRSVFSALIFPQFSKRALRPIRVGKRCFDEVQRRT